MLWQLNKPFSSLIGCELQQFSSYAAELGRWMLKEKIIFIARPDFVALCKALIVWTDIEQFLKIGKTFSHNLYQEKMKEFQNNVDIFYEAGKKSILRDGKRRQTRDCLHTHTKILYDRYYQESLQQAPSWRGNFYLTRSKHDC